MTELRSGRRLRTGDWVLAALVVLAVLGVTGAAVVQVTRADDARRATTAEEAAGTVASGVAVDLGVGLRQVSLAASSFPALGFTAIAGQPDSVAPGSDDLGFVPVAGELPEPLQPPVLSEQDRESPTIATALARALESGGAQLTAPVERAEGARSLIVAATYAPGATPGPPVSTSDRRARVTGWIVASVDLARLAADHTPEGAAVTVGDSSETDAAAARADDATEEQLVDVGERRLLVEAEIEDAGSLPAEAIVVGVAGVVLAVVIVALLLTTRRRLVLAEEEVDARGSQVRLIGDVAPLVQQSLELADVLPSVAVQLSDHFGLAGIALSSGTNRGEQLQVFSLGMEADPTVKAALQPPAHLDAGETLRLALQRGGRSVAVLQVVAGRPLGFVELESLRALSELVTAALVNASLYASQQEALKRLRELDGLKTVFLGTASHELRTPATAIAGFAGLLTSSWDRFSDEQRRDFVDRIGANARSLSTVVQDLLDFSLLDRGTLAIALAQLDLGSVVEGVLDRLGPAFGDHTIESDLQPTAPVEGDRNGLERITTNLLTNAVKFSPMGTTIRVNVRAAGAYSVMEVCDQGPGVPADEREQVFTRFYRGTGDAVLQTRGVGIGLSVVSEFVARMNGEVSVDDAPGGGARFTVRLPAVAAKTNEEVADATSA